MKLRIVLSCIFALALASLGCGCGPDSAKPYDDVDDIQKPATTPASTPDASLGDNGIGTSPNVTALHSAAVQKVVAGPREGGVIIEKR